MKNWLPIVVVGWKEMYFLDEEYALKDWKEVLPPTPAMRDLVDSQTEEGDGCQTLPDLEQSQGGYPLDGCYGAAEIRLNSCRGKVRWKIDLGALEELVLVVVVGLGRTRGDIALYQFYD